MDANREKLKVALKVIAYNAGSQELNGIQPEELDLLGPKANGIKDKPYELKDYAIESILDVLISGSSGLSDLTKIALKSAGLSK